ncbi:hypothetical protein RSAG8_09841, partial [Rhizoctonia solani AG-8 WAC10335]
MWICLGICCVSLVGASFATQVRVGHTLPIVWVAHLSRLGVADSLAPRSMLWDRRWWALRPGYCLCGSFRALPSSVYSYSAFLQLPEWFSARKGLAGAIIFGGAGTGGALYPLASNYMLKELGFRWTLRIWALYMLVLGALSLLSIKPRVPAIRPPGGSQCDFLTFVKQQDWSFVKSPPFLCIVSFLLYPPVLGCGLTRCDEKSILSFIQALGYFPVPLYMSVYTTSLGFPTINGTVVLVVFSLASVVGMALYLDTRTCKPTQFFSGQVLLGQLCDTVPYQYIIIASGVGSCLAAFLLWGFAHNLGLIFGFVIIFGIMVCSPSVVIHSRN